MILRHDSMHRPPRRGVVLLATMVVIVMMALTAYHFADHASEELQTSDAGHRQAQAKALAESGVHYMAGWLTMNYLANMGAATAGVSPYDDPSFMNKPVKINGKNGYSGKFTLIAPCDPGNVYPASPNSQQNRYGVTDETGKINYNAFLLMWGSWSGATAPVSGSSGSTNSGSTNSGSTNSGSNSGSNSGGGSGSNPNPMLVLYYMLGSLPPLANNTTLAGAVIDWFDYDSTPFPNGGSETYGFSPRNGPMDSPEELLFVTGMTPAIMYGNDRNRNGIIDQKEGGGQYQTGLWDYTTTYSRELLVTPQGAPMAWLNDTPQNLQAGPMMTAPNLGQQMVNFILLARQNGLTAATTKSSSSGSNTGAANSPKPNVGNLSSPPQTDLDLSKPFPTTNNITSIWSLVGSTVKCTSTDDNNKTTTTVYTCPIAMTSDPSILTDMFLFTTTWPTSSGKGGGKGGGSSGSSKSGSGSSSSSSTSSSSTSSSSSSSTAITLPWTGPELTQVAYERPARININTCHPDVLYALLNALQQIQQTAGNSGSGSNNSTNLTSLAAPILAARPMLNAPVPVAQQSPAWLLNVSGVTPQICQQLEPFITTQSQVFRVQSVGILDGKNSTTARVEAVIDTNGGYPRILMWRDLSELGRGIGGEK